MRAPIDDPLMAEFVALIDKIDSHAAESSGFVDQPKLPDEGEVFSGLTLINVSIWRTVEALREFTYRGEHALALNKRLQWFEEPSGANYVLFWIPAGELPTETEIKKRLDHLELNGPTPYAFTLHKHFTIQEMLNQE
jgi:hypothetical protein